jgi:hypothetical protein
MKGQGHTRSEGDEGFLTARELLDPETLVRFRVKGDLDRDAGVAVDSRRSSVFIFVLVFVIRLRQQNTRPR